MRENLTDFGREIKKGLIDLGRGYDWLAAEVTARTGLYCDAAYISRIAYGMRNAPKIAAAIAEILGVQRQS